MRGVINLTRMRNWQSRPIHRAIIMFAFPIGMIFSITIVSSVVGTFRQISQKPVTNSGLSSKWVETIMNRYLIEVDSKLGQSPIHLLADAKVDSEIIEMAVKTVVRVRPIILRSYEICKVCNIHEYKINYIVGFFVAVGDIRPLAWHEDYDPKCRNTRAKILIFVTGFASRDSVKDGISHLEKFWTKDYLNVVMILRLDEDDAPIILSYNPFLGKSEIASDAHTEQTFIKPFETIRLLFPDKLTNLNGHNIRIRLYNQIPHATIDDGETLHGTLFSFIHYLKEWLNFGLEKIDLHQNIDASNYTVILPTGQKVGPVGDVIKGETDVVGNPGILDTAIGQNVEYLNPFHRICMQVLVPRSKPMSAIARTFRSIKFDTACIIMLCLILLAFFYHVRGYEDAALRAFRVFITQLLGRVSNHPAERIFLGSWIIWAFVVATAIQSNLIKDLTDPPYYPYINRFRELADSEVTLIVDTMVHKQLQESMSPVVKKVAANAKVEDDHQCIQWFSERRNVACVMDSDIIHHQAMRLDNMMGYSKSHGHSGDGVAHVIDKCLTENWRTIFVRDGLPYLDKFNVAHDRMNQFGLVSKWRADSLRRTYKDGANPETALNDSLRILNMSHFEGPFKILFIGNFIAALVLLGEIMIPHLKANNFAFYIVVIPKRR